MAYLWFRDEDDVWAALPLNGRAVDISVYPPRALGDFQLGGEVWAAVIPADAGSAPTWVLLAGDGGGVRVNGLAPVAGMRVLQDRDEIRAGSSAPLFFSAETLARVEAFPGAERTIYCARCRQPMQNGEGALAVRCPGCDVWYHQTDSLPCWTYAQTCALCPQKTALDAALSWIPGA